MASLTGDAQRWRAGDWWRLVTPILVQPAGWGQLIFNLLGIGVVGAAVERRMGSVGWIIIYLVGGIGTIALLSLLHPLYRDGGSSNAVAALIGAFSVLCVSKTPAERRDAMAQFYSIFFAVYLTALLFGTGWWSGVLGNVFVIALVMAHRIFTLQRAAQFVFGIVLGCGLLQTAQQEGHGMGLLLGILVAMLFRRSA